MTNLPYSANATNHNRTTTPARAPKTRYNTPASHTKTFQPTYDLSAMSMADKRYQTQWLLIDTLTAPFKSLVSVKTVIGSKIVTTDDRCFLTTDSKVTLITVDFEQFTAIEKALWEATDRFYCQYSPTDQQSPYYINQLKQRLKVSIKLAYDESLVWLTDELVEALIESSDNDELLEYYSDDFTFLAARALINFDQWLKARYNSVSKLYDFYNIEAGNHLSLELIECMDIDMTDPDYWSYLGLLSEMFEDNFNRLMIQSMTGSEGWAQLFDESMSDCNLLCIV